MDYETVDLIVSRPSLSTMSLCRECCIAIDGNIARIAIDIETLNEIDSIKLTHACNDCWED